MGDFNVNFREMTDGEFEKFVEDSIVDYSKDLVKSAFCPEEDAFETAKKHFDELLPMGKNTADSYVYTIINRENEPVGVIWYKEHAKGVAFICDFLIYENHRKKGYGKQTLLLLDEVTREKGIKKILLHVFKFNKTAFSLYESIEYKVVKEDGGSIYMAKVI